MYIRIDENKWGRSEFHYEDCDCHESIRRTCVSDKNLS
jgi:hypothetical protein